MVKKLVFCVLFGLIPLVTLLSTLDLSPGEPNYPNYPSASASLLEFENLIRRGLPFRRELLRLYDTFDISGGRREITTMDYGYSSTQKGIFVGGGYLMKNIYAPVDRYVQENSSGVIEFAESMRQYRKQVYLMLLPTSGAILQQNLPRYAGSVMVNQRQFIEGVYSAVSGSVITVDAYSMLIQRQSQYIYYRTENNLTSLGGYFVYSAMLPRMGIGEADYNQFDIDYTGDAYYGDLYKAVGYADVRPDIISLFRYSETNRVPREFLVTHINGGESKTYHTLFPKEARTIGDPQDIFLGGLSPVIDIKTSLQFSSKVLIFGDKTALAYAPFLAGNCGRVTVVDLFYGTNEFESINPADYDKIIFAYGVETFMHTGSPARAVNLLK